MEYVLYSAVALALISIFAVFFFMGVLLRHYAELHEQAQEREERLLGMIVANENRIHASDLSGYMALQANDLAQNQKQNGNGKQRGGRSDEEEAWLESQRILMAQSEDELS